MFNKNMYSHHSILVLNILINISLAFKRAVTHFFMENKGANKMAAITMYFICMFLGVFRHVNKYILGY
jgi:hypothetical protein